MTMPGTRQHRHSTLMRAVTATWLLLISAAVVINHVALSHLSGQVETLATSARVEALEQRLAEAIEQLAQPQTWPDALPQARYETERTALEQRLSAIEQALSSHSTEAALQPLQARLEQLEARFTAPRPAPHAAPRPRLPAPPTPKEAEPPFRVMGSELRGGEQFLSILPANTNGHALAQIRLLRPSEIESGWYLERVEGDTAIFRHGDDTRRLPGPRIRCIW
ncbi:hypothetical protein [Pseudomonas lopnurensis]|uniref:hypothetical protein n=1 Tax=Pseudomonas lopnurensis TaxID=1477517 RepID=UPI0028AC06B3|nr:hypothetical protein [Pseudomonas lopnurensis]